MVVASSGCWLRRGCDGINVAAELGASVVDGWVDGEGLGDGAGMDAGGLACRGRLEKGSVDWEGGVGWSDACLFLGAALVVAFWAGRGVGSAGAPGVGGDEWSPGVGEGVSGR